MPKTHVPCYYTAWRSVGSRRARWRWCPSVVCVCSTWGLAPPAQPAEASGCSAVTLLQGGSLGYVLFACLHSYTPVGSKQVQNSTSVIQYKTKLRCHVCNEHSGTHLITVLTKVISVGLNDGQSELRDLFYSHLRMPL